MEGESKGHCKEGGGGETLEGGCCRTGEGGSKGGEVEEKECERLELTYE